MNWAKRSIKPFVIGRKNWLFANSKNGAQAGAIYYSLNETAKGNNMRPREYLEFLLTQFRLGTVNSLTMDRLDTLMPWSYIIPENYRLG